ncbi:MAG: HflK protein [Candidatus Omnitrophica bacterium CG1_02_44_16]|nr:MAG: HflK protein [Candidatus Omnitrophica bacterium CG1_02_44_16]PIY83572.1 MAG: FtsH protease activity modulator HflK [Candidatus Omnitrophica bacterium CG_4_10_14_0_8_um_filter_44_12]PIZ83974.1 MAG: FtsH protease activity modulator HflK [Candidatus Omnitrophica bacterium CG_4_10_14_0_2_um_filter_44_9]
MEWKNHVPTPEDIINIDNKVILKYLSWAILGFFILAGLKGIIYSIGPDEVGVIQRFGKYIALSSPGLHAKIPLGVDKATPIKVEKVFKKEFGFKTIEPGERTRYSSGDYRDESLMLTGDLNILDVRWIVQFKIKDPVKLLFATRNPDENIHDISEVVMRRFVGDYSVDEVLTTKREEIDDLAQQEIQRILDIYNVGVQIITVKLLDVNPPEKVKPAFNEVNEAKQEKEKMINQAWEAYNKVIPKAKGTAEKTIREAEGYATDKINRAKGESERFLATLEEYKKAPDITRQRLYLETLTQVLPNAKEKYIIDSQQKSILPLLDINKKGGQE